MSDSLRWGILGTGYIATEFTQDLLATGMKPTMARLTLARKIAAIVLTIWKKGGRFDPEQLKRQAA